MPSRDRRRSGGSPTKAEPAEILPPEERKAAMSTLDPMEAKWTLGAFVLATVAGIAIPAYFVAENKVTKAGKNSIAVAPDAKLLGGAHPDPVRHRVRGPVEAQAHAGGLRPLPDRLRLHDLRRADRVRLHPSRRLADAAGLADQQVRHHEFQGDRPGGGGAASGTGAQGSRPVDVQDDFQPWRTQATDRQQALHAESSTSEEDPQARPSRPADHRTSADSRRFRRDQLAGSIRSAERNNWSASVRRRTSERAVGSSPSARNTSTSVTIPITVE